MDFTDAGVKRRASSRRRALATASLASAAGFIVVSVAVTRRLTRKLDRRARRAIHPRRRRKVTQVARLATNLGAPNVHPFLALALAAVATRLRGQIAYRVPLASLAATVADKSLRVVIHQRRPPLSGPHHGLDQFAFPSGHTCAITAIAVAFVAETWPALSDTQRKALASAGAAASMGVAWTRLYLDEHWIDDIVGGWLAGIAIGSGVGALGDWSPRSASTSSVWK